nr:MAG TPA: hypothetical protein [Bacteriophage sp.]
MRFRSSRFTVCILLTYYVLHYSVQFAHCQ